MSELTPEVLDVLEREAREDGTCFYCDRPSSSCGELCVPVVSIEADTLLALVSSHRDHLLVQRAAEDLVVQRDEARAEVERLKAQVERLRDEALGGAVDIRRLLKRTAGGFVNCGHITGGICAQCGGS